MTRKEIVEEFRAVEAAVAGAIRPGSRASVVASALLHDVGAWIDCGDHDAAYVDVSRLWALVDDVELNRTSEPK